MAASPSAEKLTRMDNKPNFSREVKLQWAGSLEKEISPGRGGAFFLTSLFIELIDPDCWCNRLWVLKNSVIGMSFWLRVSLLPSFFFLARIQAEPGRSQLGFR